MKGWLEAILEEIGEEDSLAALKPCRSEPAEEACGKTPFFLEEGILGGLCRYCGLEREQTSAVLDAARKIAGNPPLAGLARHCRGLLFFSKDYDRKLIPGWPSLERVLGGDGSLFYLIIALSMVPEVRKTHLSMRIPEEVTRQTCSQVSCFCRNYQLGAGRCGIYKKQLYWLRNYLEGRLFRIGRMEYMLEPFKADIAVFRDRYSGRITALMGDGLRINPDGYIDAPETEAPPRGTWVSSLARNGESVSGFAISPHGYLTRRFVTLPLEEWEPVLAKGMPVLEMHIPAGGGMTPEKCGESMKDAVDFFKSRFPEKPFSAVASYSWIFNPMLGDILPSDSNLVRFQEELFLFPVPSTGKDGLWFIFFRDDFSPENLPRETSLQRAVGSFLAGGEKWRSGGMFLLPEHLEHFGRQFYRKNGPGTG